MSDIKLGITLTADGGGLVGEVRASKQELDKLGNSSQTAGNKSRVAGKKIAMMGVAIKKTRSFVGGLSNQLFSLKGLFLSLGAGVAAKSFVSAASAAEQYRVRLTVLLGSQAEGNRLFEEMADFAGKVPFEYEKIMSSATQLSGVMSGGVDEIKQWMPLIGDLAATSGLSIEQTTEQVIRMYSAGAGAADLFRDRGITAMLGFEFGVSYSAEQTRKKLMDEWTKMDSQFGGATGLLAGTWSGMLSMMSDKWFRFRTWLMDGGLFDYLKAIVIIFNNDIDKAMKDSADQAENWSMAIINGMENATTSVGVFIDGWHGLKIVFAGLKVIMWGFAGAVNTVAAGLSTMLTSMINGLLSWVKKALSVLSPFNKTAAEAYAGISNMQAATAVAAAGMQDIADQTVASIIASKLELHNLAMELPSDTIKQKLKEIRDQFDLNRKKSKQTADEGKKDAAGMGAALSNLKQDALDLESGLDGFGSGIKSGLVTVENAASGAARSFENDWGKAVRTGKLDFSSFVDSVLDDLIRMQYQATVGNAISGYLNAFIGGIANIGTSSTYGTDFGSQQTGMLADQDAPISFNSHATGLSNVPHDGYIAKLHKNEAIIDARTMAGMRKYGLPTGGASPATSNVVSITNHNDFSSVSSADEGRIQQMLDENSRQTEARIYANMNRGGSVSRISGRR